MPELPKDFLDRLASIIPQEYWLQVRNSFEKIKPVTFRVNRLKAQPESVMNELQGQGFSLQPVAWNQEAFILKQGTQRELQDTPAYREGRIYLQELSSMVPVLLLDPQPGETVLDMAAAPGSKTTQIAALMQNRGKLFANDPSRSRFFKLKANLEAQGVQNAVLSQKPGEKFSRSHPEFFDLILLDTPCSGEGRFHRAEPESFCEWKLSKIKSLVPRQKMLFYSAFQALKPGGVLVYSTCTFAPEENEGILDWALEKFGDRLSIEEIKLPFSNQMSGLAGWKKKIYPPEVRNAVRILPDEMMEGFFVAKIKKVMRDEK